MRCNSTCLNEECMKINGHCSNGGRRGFYGEFCNLHCSEKCAQIDCRQNGTCIGGCKPHWTGQKCDIVDLASGNCSNTNVYSVLYGVITILFISISINFIYIVRNITQNISNMKNSEKITRQKNPIRDSNTAAALYDIVEDNAGYQELRQFSQPSLYDKLS
ncbi:uncharacterized protein LOC134230153 [Saccostrea cucullata]|uniref:uncharacterized protein LOC134230153 n=1 Tax=Saccostrea cuccullata TaxID=36930 RepID=UPI002ED0ABD2